MIYKELVKLALNHNNERCVCVTAATFYCCVACFVFALCAKVCPVSCSPHPSPSFPARCSNLPGFGFFYAYWFVVAVIFLYLRTLKNVFLVRQRRRGDGCDAAVFSSHASPPLSLSLSLSLYPSCRWHL